MEEDFSHTENKTRTCVHGEAQRRCGALNKGEQDEAKSGLRRTRESQKGGPQNERGWDTAGQETRLDGTGQGRIWTGCPSEQNRALFCKKCEADVMMNSSQSKNGCWFPSYSQEILKRCLLMFCRINCQCFLIDTEDNILAGIHQT